MLPSPIWKEIIDSAIQTKAIDLSFPIPRPTSPHCPPLKKKRQREFDLAMKWKVNLICRQKSNNKKLEKGQNLFIIEGFFTDLNKSDSLFNTTYVLLNFFFAFKDMM